MMKNIFFLDVLIYRGFKLIAATYQYIQPDQTKPATLTRTKVVTKHDKNYKEKEDFKSRGSTS